jgi:hypothetical protein
LGLIPVSIEPRHKSASVDALYIAIDQELNIFEDFLSLKARQPPFTTVCPCFLHNILAFLVTY